MSTRSEPAAGLRRIVVPLLLAAAVIVAFASKPGREATRPASAPAPAPTGSHGGTVQTAGVPRLVDFGADRCIPCKSMAPILAELRAEYAGRLQVDFIDVWKNPRAGDPYNVYAIPTQIFFDGSGRELTRHQGFISKQDILDTWRRFGVEFSAPRAVHAGKLRHLVDTLFTALSHAVEGQPAIALAAAFAWGLASLLLSPCHLASIPLVVGFVNGQGQATPARGAAIAGAFSLGLFTTIGAIGIVTAAAGRLMGDVGPLGQLRRGGGVLRGRAVAARCTAPRVERTGFDAFSRARSSRGVGARTDLRHRVGTMHLLVHGPDAGRDLCRGRHARRVRRAAHHGVRHRPLFDHRPCRRIDELGGPLPSVDECFARRGAPQARIRAARVGGRGVFDLHRVRRRQRGPTPVDSNNNSTTGCAISTDVSVESRAKRRSALPRQ